MTTETTTPPAPTLPEMNRRSFFNRLTSGLFAASEPGLFPPKLIKPAWKPMRRELASNIYFEQIQKYQIDVEDYIRLDLIRQLAGKWDSFILK